MLTPPESMVFGTAIRMGGGCFRALMAVWAVSGWGMPSRHIAKEQKLRVLTVSICSSHG